MRDRGATAPDWKIRTSRCKIFDSCWPSGSLGFPMTSATDISTGIRAHRAGLDLWMDRVLERADKVPPDWNADDVHDLRTALRRCRTMADALEQVNPAPGWRKLKHGS